MFLVIGCFFFSLGIALAWGLGWDDRVISSRGLGLQFIMQQVQHSRSLKHCFDFGFGLEPGL